MTHNVSKREPHKAKGLSRNERRYDDGPRPEYQSERKSSQRSTQPQRGAVRSEGNVTWGRFA